MNDKKSYVSSIVTEIQQVAELFYQQQKADAFSRFAILLNSLSQASQLFYQCKEAGDIKEFDDKQYLNVLVQAMNSLEAGDEVLLADILNYDLSDQIQNILEQL